MLDKEKRILNTYVVTGLFDPYKVLCIASHNLKLVVLTNIKLLTLYIAWTLYGNNLLRLHYCSLQHQQLYAID